MHLVLDNISKHYGGKRLFGGISAQVRPGECLAITGPNGAGKSTLLRTVAGLERPTGGAVRLYRAECLLQGAERQQAVGMITPEMNLYGLLSARENLEFFCRLRRLSTAGIPDALERVGLTPSAERPVAEFSTGMRQRLKWAVLLNSAAQLWLLDEPFSNLDADGRTRLETVLQGALQQGVMVLLATNEERELAYAGQSLNVAD